MDLMKSYNNITKYSNDKIVAKQSVTKQEKHDALLVGYNVCSNDIDIWHI